LTKFLPTPANALRGGITYGIGDTVASLLLHQFSWVRLLGIALVGATLYAWEVPIAFRWIARVVHGKSYRSIRSVLLAMAYFNPLWIARHLLIINLLSGNWALIGWGLLLTAAKSFGGNLPLPLVANYFIQNKVPLKHRFLVSSCFSAVMVVYYALSATWFGAEPAPPPALNP
jgi:hypothetical protein